MYEHAGNSHVAAEVANVILEQQASQLRFQGWMNE